MNVLLFARRVLSSIFQFCSKLAKQNTSEMVSTETNKVTVLV